MAGWPSRPKRFEDVGSRVSKQATLALPRDDGGRALAGLLHHAPVGLPVREGPSGWGWPGVKRIVMSLPTELRTVTVEPPPQPGMNVED
jgi:RNA:NAD 2'-phosphotransferase (TPT1/KptA family)